MYSGARERRWASTSEYSAERGGRKRPEITV